MSAGAIDPAGALDPDLLTARILDVDGVTDVFAPSATVTQVPQLVATLVTGSPQRLNRVAVSTRGNTVAISARVGTGRESPTPETAQRVADALLAGVPDDRDAIVTVQVARIASSIIKP